MTSSSSVFFFADYCWHRQNPYVRLMRFFFCLHVHNGTIGTIFFYKDILNYSKRSLCNHWVMRGIYVHVWLPRGWSSCGSQTKIGTCKRIFSVQNTTWVLSSKHCLNNCHEHDKILNLTNYYSVCRWKKVNMHLTNSFLYPIIHPERTYL